MQIPLDTFESFIDRRIVERGYTYFTDGLVADLDSSGDGDYEAVVSGSEDYEVIIQLRSGFVEQYDCDCPFDSGPVCKHVAAVLFAVRELEEQVFSIEDPESPGPEPGRTKEINELIDACPEQELKVFLKAYSRKHVSFVTEFLSAFPDPETSDGMYRRQLKNILRKVSDSRDGFIDWNAARGIARDLDRLIGIAEQYQARGEHEAVLAICTAMAEELADVLEYADDSDGIIGGAIDASFNMLTELTRSDVQFARGHLWQFLVWNYKKGTFKGWDWHLVLLELLVQLADNEERIRQVRLFLEEKDDSEYDREKKEFLYFEMIHASGDVTGAEQFAKKHPSNPYLREQLIKEAVARQDFEVAVKMAEDGFRTDQEDKPGLAKKWQNWLLEVYLEQGDVRKIIELSRILFIDGFLQDRDYFSLLKAHCHPDQWESELESLVKELAQSGWNRTHRIADVYIRESKTDKLLELLTSETGLHILQVYDGQLAKSYPLELANLYARELPGFLEVRVSRKYYQEACRIINRIRQLGAKELSDQLIGLFKKNYPQRRALIEELNRL